MRSRFLLSLLVCLLTTLSAQADNDIMITRDGSMIPVKIERISSAQVTFYNLKEKRRGLLNAPADFVYMIIKAKGNNILFDEEGNQMTTPAVKFGNKDDVMFLNNGKVFPIYNISVNKDEVVYQMQDKKKSPLYKSMKSEVFMIRNSDGTTTLYNDAYRKKREAQKLAQQTAAQQSGAQLASAQPVQASAAPAGGAGTSAVAKGAFGLLGSAVAKTASAGSTAKTVASEGAAVAGAAAGGQQLLASAVTSSPFKPAPDLSPVDIEMAVNAKNPYTLYRKGSVAEYCFQYKGKQTQYMGGPTYVQQIVEDEKIENGLLVAYIKQAFFNKKHEPSKGVSASYKDYIFPVEIDTAGTYHWTHNILQDFMMIVKRQGYGVLVPGDLTPGTELQCSSLYDTSKNGYGSNVKVVTTYSGWKVMGQEPINVPAGTFDCVKLQGSLSVKGGLMGSSTEQITCWIARGVGIVQYESVTESRKAQEPFVLYLNKLELK